jgi:4-aminobutyrate aminotransferase-like enzyme
MSLALEPSPASSQTTDLSRKQPLKATSLLHRTPWRPPVGVSAKGIYIDLDDGRRLIDAVGGAAVACIGSSHPAVMQSIKDQIDKVSCRVLFHLD